jgi:hypothetical protein
MTYKYSRFGKLPMSGDRLPEKLRVDKSLQRKKRKKKGKQCAHILAKTHCQNCLKI